jgi:hypothetical protein
VLRATTSSSSSASSPDSKATTHEVQASSRVWASPLRRPATRLRPCPPQPPGSPGRQPLSCPRGQCALEGLRQPRLAREPLPRQRRPDRTTRAPPH